MPSSRVSSRNFRASHPKVTIDVEVGSNGELLQKLEEGSLDCVITYDIELPTVLSRHILYHTHPLVVLHPEDPLTAYSVLDLPQLSDEPLILFDSAPVTSLLERAFSQRGLMPPRIGASVPQMILALSLIGKRLGYGLLMSRPNGVFRTAEGIELTTRPLPQPMFQTEVVGIWPDGTKPNRRVQALLDFITQRIGA